MTNINISTCVFIADTTLNSSKNPTRLKQLFDSLDVIPYKEKTNEGLIKISFRGYTKGDAKKDVHATKKTRKKISNFRNQISFYTRINDIVTTKFIYYDDLPKPKKIDAKKSFTLVSDDIIQQSHILLKGKTMINFNSIRLTILGNLALNNRTIRIFTSVPRKAYVHYLNDITYEITDEDIKNGFIEFSFIDKNFADGIFVVDSQRCLDFDHVKIDFVIEANMFLFLTGKIKIAGTTCREQADRSLQILITNIEKSFDEIFGISYTLNSIETIMINSDFSVDFDIGCNNLYRILRNEYVVSYEPNTHPAVIIKFTINTKNVSVLIFSSGKIIITGGNTFEQINIAHNKINQILHQNRDTIEI